MSTSANVVYEIDFLNGSNVEQAQFRFPESELYLEAK
jgi:hypothetical protein